MSDFLDAAAARATHNQDDGCENPEPGESKPEPLAPVSIGKLTEQHPQLREPVIHGIVRAGETCNIIAPSKVGKSWLAYSLALCIVTGRHWLDAFLCEPGRVLLIDNELHVETVAHRIPVVAEAMSIRRNDYGDGIDVVSLRGCLTDYIGLGGRLIDRIEAGHYRAVIVDAHYRMLPAGTNENDNAGIAMLYNLIDRYARQTESVWFLIHHSGKGSQTEKSVTDVGSGAGSQSRAADTHLILRPHEEAGHVVLEAAVRSWPPLEPVALQWCFPLWLPSDIDPAALKGRRTKSEERQSEKDREATATVKAALSIGPATNRELRRRTGLSRERCERILDQLESAGEVSGTTIKKRGNECREYQLQDVGD